MRTMRSSEMLDTALRIYQRQGWTFLKLTVAPSVLCLASIGFVINFVLPTMFTTRGDGGGADIFSETIASLSLAIFVGGPVFLLGLSYSSAIVVSLVSDHLLGKPGDPEAAVERATSVLSKLFLVNLRELCLSASGIVAASLILAFGGYVQRTTPDSDATAGILAVIGILGLIGGVSVVLALVAYDALVVPIAVLESLGSRVSAKRSRTLLRRSGYHPGGTGTVWLLYGLLAFMAMVLSLGMTFFIEILELKDHAASLFGSSPTTQVFAVALNLLPAFIVIWTLVPVWASAITIIYYERRIRLEGFDIDVLASEIAPSNPSFTPSK